MGSVNSQLVNSFVLRKQHLTKDTKTDDILQITKDIVGLHATSPTTPYLSLFARTHNFSKEQLDTEIGVKKTFGKIRCMRLTVHILPKETVSMVYFATKSLVETTAEKYSRYLGVTTEQYEELSKSILGIVKGKAMTVKEIKEVVKTQVNVSSLVNIMCDRALLIRGNSRQGWKSNIHTYQRFDEVFHDIDMNSGDEEKAKEMLIRNYIASFGPVSVNDVVWWTGFRKREVMTCLEKLQGQIVHVEISDIKTDCLLLNTDLKHRDLLKSEKEDVVSFLPLLDPYVMGYKERERYLDPEYYSNVFDRSGNATSTILLNGKIVGVWDVMKKESVVKLFLFDKVGKSVMDEIHRVARNVGKFVLESDVQVKKCEFMVSLPQRSAGSFMSPLKDC